MCKTGERTKEGAEKELHESLKRLKTDYFDLYQLHAMTTEEDFKKVTGSNGALKTFLKVKKERLIRYIGFSAHSVEIALKLIDVFDFDSEEIEYLEKQAKGLEPIFKLETAS